jgi:hypothetical protein
MAGYTYWSCWRSWSGVGFFISERAVFRERPTLCEMAWRPKGGRLLLEGITASIFHEVLDVGFLTKFDSKTRRTEQMRSKAWSYRATLSLETFKQMNNRHEHPQTGIRVLKQVSILRCPSCPFARDFSHCSHSPADTNCYCSLFCGFHRVGGRVRTRLKRAVFGFLRQTSRFKLPYLFGVFFPSCSVTSRFLATFS